MLYKSCYDLSTEILRNLVSCFCTAADNPPSRVCSANRGRIPERRRLRQAEAGSGQGGIVILELPCRCKDLSTKDLFTNNRKAFALHR